MIELDLKVWDGLVYEFGKRLGEGQTIDQSLSRFLDDYWSILDSISMEAGLREENVIKESPEEYATKTYLREKNQIIWDYVYNLNREIGNLKKEVALLKEANAARQTYQPVNHPNNIPPLDWYKITANGNVPLSGVKEDRIHTTGYMQVVDEPKYTQEQINEWADIRYTPNEQKSELFYDSMR